MVRLFVGSLALLLLAYLISPYVALWRLDRALANDDRTALARRVDLAAVRSEIARRLDKTAGGTPEAPSDAFIDWLERGIRRHGVAVLEQQVSLDWVRGLLLDQAPPGHGMGPALTGAFFDDPLHFSVRLQHQDRAPVRLRMDFNGLGWRVAAISY